MELLAVGFVLTLAGFGAVALGASLALLTLWALRTRTRKRKVEDVMRTWPRH